MLIEKTCPVCEEKFLGRANKLYHFACKVKLNNRTAADRRRKGRPLRDTISLNDLLLRYLYRRSRYTKKAISVKTWNQSGVYQDKFNYTVELEGGKFIFHICYKFGWALSPDSEEVIILPELLIRAKKRKEDKENS